VRRADRLGQSGNSDAGCPPQRQNPTALETVHLSVITFDDEAKQIVPLTELIQFRYPTLTVETSLTSLGRGLTLLAERIDQEVTKTTLNTKGDWKPLVFIMTDGEPTDDWQAGIEKFKQVKTGTVVACAASQDCDTYILKKITDNVDRDGPDRPVHARKLLQVGVVLGRHGEPENRARER
jgi:uncharacterized protein YegL